MNSMKTRAALCLAMGLCSLGFAGEKPGMQAATDAEKQKAEENRARNDYRALVREYQKAGTELARAVQQTTVKEKAEQAGPSDYSQILTLRNRKDRLYEQISFAALRYGWEIPEEAGQAGPPPADAAQEAKALAGMPFRAGKALVLENLRKDAREAAAAAVATRCLKAPGCDLSGKEASCDVCGLLSGKLR